MARVVGVGWGFCTGLRPPTAVEFWVQQGNQIGHPLQSCRNIVCRSVIAVMAVPVGNPAHANCMYVGSAWRTREPPPREREGEGLQRFGCGNNGGSYKLLLPQQVLTTAVCGDVDGSGPDYMHLPCPVKYDEITREAYMSLKPDLFEGLRFDITRPINNKFALSNSLFMGQVDLPGNSSPVVKQSKAHFELGTSLVDEKGKMDIVMMIKGVLSEGRMSARVKYDVNDRFSIKADAQLTNDPRFTVGMFNFDYKGNDYQAQLTMGNNAYYGVNYMQSVTPKLSLGREGIWLGRERKSNMGLAARFKTDTVIATGLVKSEGQMSCTYVQKLSDKISVASDFMYNWESGEAMTSIAYDYLIRQCRVRGRVDTNLCTAAYLEEKFSSGLTFLLSAELDHWRKDYKFGFGMTIGD